MKITIERNLGSFDIAIDPSYEGEKWYNSDVFGALHTALLKHECDAALMFYGQGATRHGNCSACAQGQSERGEGTIEHPAQEAQRK